MKYSAPLHLCTQLKEVTIVDAKGVSSFNSKGFTNSLNRGPIKIRLGCPGYSFQEVDLRQIALLSDFMNVRLMIISG